MSDEKVIHVAHEFVPKLIRRKVEAAIANREKFVNERKHQMVPLLLANRNHYIARQSRKWFPSKDRVVEIADVAKLPFENYRALKYAIDPWRWHGTRYIYDQAARGPHWSELNRLADEIAKGSNAVDHIYALHENLRRTPTRRVSISEKILSSITYWADDSNFAD